MVDILIPFVFIFTYPICDRNKSLSCRIRHYKTPNNKSPNALAAADIPKLVANVQHRAVGRRPLPTRQNCADGGGGKRGKNQSTLLAQQVVDKLDLDGIVTTIDIAGRPALSLNMTMAPAYLSHR